MTGKVEEVIFQEFIYLNLFDIHVIYVIEIYLCVLVMFVLGVFLVKCQAWILQYMYQFFFIILQEFCLKVNQFVFVSGAEDYKELWGQRTIRSKCLSVWIRRWWEWTLVSLNHTVSNKGHESSGHQGNTPVSSYDGFTSLRWCSSVSEARKVFVYVNGGTDTV